ncbi:response regulator transcription factor [Cupriavidus plantarum]|uniref:response regulator transcription factor n=1 Tax=Cupriavidus plantarum TaxID=942865 RepID=UPI001B137779|nr:response regulator transcription factor [Cupriavidus plantarum]CAG2153277.1 Virulence factors putative positive transcription regulator BvgA [Cupriavidus plantarum]SMR86320.1 two component transcriptional regulator, LuxR family [Cupriavidus plantarum]
MTRILVVDDHPPVRLALRVQLAAMQDMTDVVEAENGQAALESARAEKPDLVVLDLDMPRIGGLDVAARLRSMYPEVRILVMSAQDPELFASRAWHAGAQGFCSKTQDMGCFMRCVEAVLNGYSVFPMSGRHPIPLGYESAERAEDVAMDRLSDREVVVLQMLARGMSNKSIGTALFISNKTVSSYKTRIMTKLGAETVVDLVDFARKRGLA